MVSLLGGTYYVDGNLTNPSHSIFAVGRCDVKEAHSSPKHKISHMVAFAFAVLGTGMLHSGFLLVNLNIVGFAIRHPVKL